MDQTHSHFSRKMEISRIKNHTLTEASSTYTFPRTPSRHYDALRTAPSTLHTHDACVLTLTPVAVLFNTGLSLCAKCVTIKSCDSNPENKSGHLSVRRRGSSVIERGLCLCII